MPTRSRAAFSQARIAHEMAGGQGRIHMNVLWEMAGAERVLRGVLTGAKGLIHGVTCGAGHALPDRPDRGRAQGALLPHRLFRAGVPRALEAGLSQVFRVAGRRGLRGPVARRRA